MDQFILPFEAAGPSTHPNAPGADEYRSWVASFRERQFRTFGINPGITVGVLLCFQLCDRTIKLAEAFGSDRPGPVLCVRSMQLAASALHVGLAGCLSESAAIARSAIEFAAHANYMHGKPAIEKAYLEKDQNGDAFRRLFGSSKTQEIFKPIPNLQKLHLFFQDFGAHGSLSALRIHTSAGPEAFMVLPFASHDDRPAPFVALLSLVEQTAIVVRKLLDADQEEIGRLLDLLAVFFGALKAGRFGWPPPSGNSGIANS